MKFPERKQDKPEQNYNVHPLDKPNGYIVVDSKILGIWDVVNLGNKGGLLNLSDRFALLCSKNDQKWCNIQLLMYGKESPKLKSEFVPIKKVKDDTKIEELKREMKQITSLHKEMVRENLMLKKELANFRADSGSSVEDEVYEL